MYVCMYCLMSKRSMQHHCYVYITRLCKLVHVCCSNRVYIRLTSNVSPALYVCMYI